jgi:hypothetical protein
MANMVEQAENWRVFPKSSQELAVTARSDLPNEKNYY